MSQIYISFSKECSWGGGLYAGTEIFKTKHWILDIEMNQFVDGDTS